MPRTKGVNHDGTRTLRCFFLTDEWEYICKLADLWKTSPETVLVSLCVNRMTDVHGFRVPDPTHPDAMDVVSRVIQQEGVPW